MCTGSSLELGAFSKLEWFIGGWKKKQTQKKQPFEMVRQKDLPENEWTFCDFWTVVNIVELP